ncbi:MAG: A/G-specific adenine glycosylase [Clostridia bacterium]|nr:A/G-specific adenine glycosylase [Clostridia bacterium]
MTYTEDLCTWYEQNKRDMPWRQTRDPYAIWISEVMLQQTQVDTVIPYYNSFMRRFPTIQELACAPMDEVLRYWKGLGYYKRAQNLHRGAQKLWESHQGIFPQTLKELSDIPGIGPYTAGAVLSIAFDMPVPAVDGNVMRILSRRYLIEEDITRPSARRLFEEKVLALMESVKPSVFNQALMELGALICSPKSPKCPQCPVKAYCEAFKLGLPERYPIKTKKASPEVEEIIALVIQKENRFIFERRPAEGLLANLWGFPVLDADKASLIVGAKGVFLTSVTHVFTHKKWLLKPFLLHEDSLPHELLNVIIKKPDLEHYTINEAKELPMGTAFVKVLNQLARQDGKS